MRRFSSTIQNTLIFLSIVSIVACTSSEPFKGSKTGINTLDLFFSEMEDDSIGVYIFNPGNGRATLRAEHKAGANMAFEMDTNRNKQGFEYLAYVAESSTGGDAVYLYDIDKDANRITTLWSTDDDICAILPLFRGTQDIYDESDRHTAILVHQSSIMVQIPANPLDDCDSDDKLLLSVSFEDGLSENEIVRKQESYLPRSTLIDYSFINSQPFIDGRRVTNRGRFATLGDNLSGSMALTDEDLKSLWVIDGPSPSSPIFAAQPTVELVLFQSDTDLYLVDTESLFDIEELDPDQRPQDLSELIFGTSRYTLSAPGSGQALTIKSNGNAFVLQDGDDLVLFEDDEFETIYSAPDGINSFDFYFTDNAQIHVVQRFTGYETLVRLEKIGDSWSPVAALLDGLSADAIRMDVVENDLYVSTLNLGSTTGWQAHYFDTINVISATYDNALFVVDTRVDSTDRNVLLLASESVDAEGYLITPSLYIFDYSREQGRKLKLDSNGRIELDKDNEAIAFSYGQLPSTIQSLNTATTLNDKYTRFDVMTDADLTEYYFVDLSDGKGDSLKRMLP